MSEHINKGEEMNIHEILLDRAKKEGVKWAEKGRKLSDIGEERCEKIGCNSMHDLIESVNGNVPCPYLEAFDKAYIATKTASTAPKCVECDEYSKTIYHRCLRDGYVCVPLIDDPEDLKNLKQGGCPKRVVPKPSQETPPVELAMNILDEMFEAPKPTPDEICKGVTDVQAKAPENPRVKQNIKPVKAITVKCQESGVRECLSALSEANDDRQADNKLLADHVNTIFERLDALENWKTKANEALIAVDNNQIADRETVEKWSKDLAAKQRGLIGDVMAKLTEFQGQIDGLFNLQTVAAKEIKDLQAENKELFQSRFDMSKRISTLEKAVKKGKVKK